MRSIHGVRYQAVSLAYPERDRTVFPFGSLETLDELAGDEPVRLVGVSVGPGYASSLTRAFAWEVNGGSGGSLDRDAFEYLALTLVPTVARLAEVGAGYGASERAAFELTEKLAALGEARVTMREAVRQALDVSVKTAEELCRWVLERDLAGAAYLQGLVAAVDHERFADEIVRLGLAAKGLRKDTYIPLGGQESEDDGDDR